MRATSGKQAARAWTQAAKSKAANYAPFTNDPDVLIEDWKNWYVSGRFSLAEFEEAVERILIRVAELRRTAP